TMTNEKDENGKLLSDDLRLPPFGSWLRKTSLDELPELFNIFKGDMSLIGPRPQLVRDMVFMNEQQRMRHTAKPGLSGLAQVRGRNAITWTEKLEWDLKYIEDVTFWGDVKIILDTIKVALIKQDGITDGEHATALDYGDTLLQDGKISKSQYDTLQLYASDLINEFENKKKYT
ncbi:MAG: sugar transferase, partial [Neisseriaceae bacterium]|nr:sugar transferase [Neisseriaceae bacterium]